MKKPKITLKRIVFYERMSEETNCFVADLYINGKKVGECKNDGQGGCTSYYGNSLENNEIIRQTEKYFKSLPVVVKRYNDLDLKYQPSLETEIDDLFYEYIKKKDEKKMVKHMENSILIGIPNFMGYSYFKQNRKLSEIPINILQQLVDKIKAKHCTDGKVILNTNLESLGIRV